MSQSNATDSGQAPGAESLRERIARHLAGTTIGSNFGASIERIALGRGDQRVECRDCNGLGFRDHTEAELRDFGERLRNLRREAYHLARAGEEEIEGPKNHIDLRTRMKAREQGLKLEERIADEQSSFVKGTVCKTCRGSRYVPRERVEEGPRADAIFTTVQCPRCTGKTRSRVDKSVATGTSCGELMTRDDAAAQHQDVCPMCVVYGKDGRGAGYCVPITARPLGRAAEFDNYVEELESVPVYYRPGQAEDDPGELLSALEKDDPMVAAAAAVYLGRYGDEWSDQRWGRGFALWPLTDAGAALCARSALTSDESGYGRRVDILKQERIAEIQADKGDPHRRALIDVADTEARILEAKVERWLLVSEAAA